MSCGKEFVREVGRKGHRKYCSDECSDRFIILYQENYRKKNNFKEFVQGN